MSLCTFESPQVDHVLNLGRDDGEEMETDDEHIFMWSILTLM